MLLTVTSQTLRAEGASPDYMSGSHRDSSVDASCQDWDASCFIMWPKTYNYPGEPVCSSTTVLKGVVPSSLLGPHRGVPGLSTVFGVGIDTIPTVIELRVHVVVEMFFAGVDFFCGIFRVQNCQRILTKLLNLIPLLWLLSG